MDKIVLSTPLRRATIADGVIIRSLSLTIVEASSLIMLNILSLTGNTLVCVSVYKNARLRTTTNLHIIFLAVSDILCAVFCNAFWNLRAYS